MLTLRPASSRGHFDFGWLDTNHSFSFGDYYDPAQMGFSDLRVLNEDRVKPGQGFGTHGHKDMEILTWVLEGALEHQDSLGNRGVLRPGMAQAMSAGRGIRHSEYNASSTEPVHFIQIWVLPEAKDLEPGYLDLSFPAEELRGRWRLIASGDGAEGSARLHQDVRVHAARLEAGTALSRELDPQRRGWLQMAKGSATVNGVALAAGDGLAISGETRLELLAAEAGEVLFFDLR